MIRSDYARTMAAYNKWLNDSLFAAAGTLDDAARKKNRGAFFGSITCDIEPFAVGKPNVDEPLYRLTETGTAQYSNLR